MASYLSYQFEDNDEFINSFDEQPLWSASFGLLLFRHLTLKHNLTVIDIGSGAGFPLLELAERLGNSCKLYGLDPWQNANKRAIQKMKSYGITNVEIKEGSAEKIPFDDNSIDLVVSNLGINNFDNPALVFNECYRVLKTNAKLALTTNIKGHWKEFYRIFESTLKQLGKDEYLVALKKEEDHRGTIENITGLFTNSGFSITNCKQENFEMKFVDGSAFLHHHFIKLGWLGSWLQLFPPGETVEIFTALEQNLNSYAAVTGELVLTVPMAYIEAEKNPAIK